MAGHFGTRTKFTLTLNTLQWPTSSHMNTFDMIPYIGSRCDAHVAIFSGVEDR